MNLMQYEIALPADYDMAIIRERVATRGRLLDDFAGLGLKAYCIRERGVGAAPVNEYAPFYLWRSTGGMNRFLWGGGGFDGILDSFGRPIVAHWVGLGVEPGPARGTRPRAASRTTEPLPVDAHPPTVVADALAALRTQAAESGVHTAALGIDPRRWELVRFMLWEDAVATADGVDYEVLHISTPELEGLQRAASAW